MRKVHHSTQRQTVNSASKATTSGTIIRAIDCTQSVPPQMSQQLQTSANSLELTSADHEAIRYFRTVFAKTYHTKNPDYSLYAIIFDIAERDPMVMRAILALGGQSIEHRRQAGMAVVPASHTATAPHPLQHYSAALRMMADTLDQREAYARFLYDLDSILSTLYLMLLYEKTFGVGDGLGLSNHLMGAAHLVEHRLQDRPLRLPCGDTLTTRTGGKSNNAALVRFYDAKQQEEQSLSLFSARMLVHLAVQDSSASTFGVGGRLMTTLNAMTDKPETTWPFADGALSLHQYSHGLYRTMWGEEYPQKELLDDLENRDVFTMCATVLQLRFAVSTLASLTPAEAEQKVAAVQDAMQQISIRFGELLAAADELSSDTDNSHRLVATLRGLVPLYYAVQIELCRAKRFLGYCAHDSHLVDISTEKIIRLAKQTYRHQGADGLVLLCWPLYLAAMETTDDGCRQWVMDRFKQLSAQGKNYERAYRFLLRCFTRRADGSDTGVEVDNVRPEMELFVL